MDSTLITALAAAGGSLVGAAATIATTWVTQRAQTHRTGREGTLRQREMLYGEFITEASRLAVKAFSHSLERPDTFVKLYGIIGRIRLFSTDAVLAASEACLRQIIDLYTKPNLSVEQVRLAFERDQLDPIRDFSIVCRKELHEIVGGE
jgi:hypothetical protein